tara:strand:- start:21895 stop:23187 length:1293 start_codon:yes stop_codon:yes gene_type:complete
MNELARRLLYVLFGILLFRIGAHIPVPGVDPQKLADFFHQQQNTILGLFNMFSGGALQRFSVFALGIMPYISASIIIQVLTAIHPSLSELKKEGESGKRKINQYTRLGTILLATIQGIAITRYLDATGMLIDSELQTLVLIVITTITGTVFLMWLGEQMTERGLGNGISLIIFAGIASALPGSFARIFDRIRDGQLLAIEGLIVIALLAALILFVVFVERAQRRIMIHYARRQQQRSMTQAQTSHLPLKVNMAGVIPVIFGSSILLFPATISNFFAFGKNIDWLNNLTLLLSPGQPLYILTMGIVIIFFSFFYTSLIFNPKETADNLKKSGALIPGIRPGVQTSKYIDKVMTKLTLIGALYLALVALLPEIMVYGWNIPFTFGGTSILIVVVVVMDFWAQAQAHLMSNQYQSIIKKQKVDTKSLFFNNKF